MTLFFQSCGLVILCVILILALNGHSKDMALLLAMAASCMAALAAMQYLEPVIRFIRELEELGGLDADSVTALLKVVGIGILSEIAALVCRDAGNASLGKTVQLLGSTVILALTVPLFSALLELIQKILGEL